MREGTEEDPMWNPTQGVARERLFAHERLDREALARLRDSGALAVDDRRRRPLYFDGRFLAARDLTREQDYFLTREADLGRNGGSGVVHGLFVSRGAGPAELAVAAGHGFTPTGEPVVLT